MSKLIDFDNSRQEFLPLDGAAQKTRVKYNGKHYILKFGEPVSSADAQKSEFGSYVHSPISEYLGCHLAQALGLDAQNTLLGTYKGREVVACEDFILPLGSFYTLVPYSSLEVSLTSSSERGHRPNLENIEKVFNEHPLLSYQPNMPKQAYWEQFVLDSIIGNYDRHGGNWGYIAALDDEGLLVDRIVSPAPVYDCGSSLSAKLAESKMQTFLNDEQALKHKALQPPKACLLIDGKQVFYQEVFNNSKQVEARNALANMAEKIATLDIEAIVNDVPCISDLRREYLMQLIASRIRFVLQPAYNSYCKAHGMSKQRLVDLGRYFNDGKNRTYLQPSTKTPEVAPKNVSNSNLTANIQAAKGVASSQSEEAPVKEDAKRSKSIQ